VGTPNDLMADAETILAQAVALLGNPPYEQAYVSLSVPILNLAACSQLAVWWENVSPRHGQFDFEQPSPIHTAQTAAVDWVVEAIRCVPNFDEGGQLPGATELHELSRELYRDAWKLYGGFTLEIMRDTLLPGRCLRIVMGAMTPVGPEGFVAGVQVRFTAEIAPSAV
jgi:hypothetical protein